MRDFSCLHGNERYKACDDESLPIAQSVHSTDRENAALEKRRTVWTGCVTYPCFLAWVNKSRRKRLCTVKPNENAEKRKPMQKLNLVEAETLLYEPLEKLSFVADGLIPAGLSLFCGS